MLSNKGQHNMKLYSGHIAFLVDIQTVMFSFAYRGRNQGQLGTTHQNRKIKQIAIKTQKKKQIQTSALYYCKHVDHIAKSEDR